MFDRDLRYITSDYMIRGRNVRVRSYGGFFSGGGLAKRTVHKLTYFFENSDFSSSFSVLKYNSVRKGDMIACDG